MKPTIEQALEGNMFSYSSSQHDRYFSEDVHLAIQKALKGWKESHIKHCNDCRYDRSCMEELDVIKHFGELK